MSDWKPPVQPRFVLIADFWDRSPDLWICDLQKLDVTDPEQANYKQAVLDAVADMGVLDTGEIVLGSAVVKGEGDRPTSVNHAAVPPPCQIDSYIILYYED